MVTSIQLGNFYSSGGRTVSGDVAGTGFDSKTYIDGLVDAKKIAVTQVQDKVDLNNKKSSALSEMNTLLKKFQDASELLRNPPGVGNAINNAFAYSSATVTSSTAVAGSSYLTVTAAAGSNLQSYTIDRIVSVAAAKKQTTDNFAIASPDSTVVFNTPGANQFGAGTIVVNGASITLESGDTLANVAAKFNNASSTSGISANVFKVSTGNYRLVFTATATGEDADFDLDDIGTVTSGGALLSNITFNDTQDASNAEFIIDDLTVIRQSNTIDDLVTGLTFNLKQATPLPADSTTLTVNLTQDTLTAKNKIIDFLNAYNDLKIFAAKQTQVNDDGTYTEDAVLASDNMLRSVLSTVSSELTRVVSGTSGTINRLSELGITFADFPESDENPFTRNILTLDEAKLDTALAGNFSGVRDIFEFKLSSDSPNLAVFSRTNALNVNDFTLVIDIDPVPANSTFQAQYTDSEGNPQTIDLDATLFSTSDGYTLKGQAGTVLEGLTLLYASTSDATISVQTSQGIADRIFNYMKDQTATGTGTIAVAQDALKSNNDRLESDITRKNQQLEDFRLQLLERFSALQQAISSINVILQSLDAQQQARNNAS